MIQITLQKADLRQFTGTEQWDHHGIARAEGCELNPDHSTGGPAMNAYNKALLALADVDLIETPKITKAEFEKLENQPTLRATCLGWTGDPMRQPPASEAASVRGII